MKRLLARVLCFAGCVSAQAGTRALLTPDNSNLRLVAFDPASGAPIEFETKPMGFWLDVTTLVDSSTIGTLRHAMQVGTEVWLTDQTANVIHRFSAQVEKPRYIGSINSIVNPRGMAMVNDEVWVASGGSGIGGGSGIVRVARGGQIISSFSAENPFAVMPFSPTTVLASNIDANQLQKFQATGSTLGALLGPWGTASTLDFPMQIIGWNESGMDRVVVVGFSGFDPGLFVYNASNGQFVKRMLTIAILQDVTVTDPRGVAVMDNGELMWTGSQGVFALNPTSGSTRVLYTGDNFTCNYVDAVDFQRYCAGDVNNDAVVDDSDFSQFVVAYNDLICPMLESGYPAGCPADLSGDGVVDDADFSIFVTAYDALLCP